MKILSLIMVLLSAVSWAQTDTTLGKLIPQKNDFEINSYGTGEISYEKGKKIQDDPRFQDSIKVASEIDYSFVDKKLESGYQVKTISAPKLSVMMPLEKLYKGYVAVGLNDFTTPPYFDFALTTLRNKKYNAGILMNHFSQEQSIKGLADARFTDSYVGVYGKKFNDKNTWYANADYNFNSFRYYGVNSETQSPLSNDGSVLQAFSLLNFKAGVDSKKRNKEAWGYNLSVNYDQLFNQTTDLAEHNIGLAATVDKFYKIGLAKVDFKSDYLTSNRYGNVHESVLFKLMPSYEIQREKLKVKAGIPLYFLTQEDRGIHAYAFAEADYAFVKGVLHVYGKVDGGFVRNSYLNYSQDNPFVFLTEDITSTNTHADVTAGMKGAFNSKTSFNAGYRYREVSDMVLYDNLGNVALNQFHVIIDDVKHRQVFGEITYLGKKAKLGLKGNYNIYDVYREEAYHLPAIYAEGMASYNLADKISLGTQLFFYGEQLTLEKYEPNGRPITRTLDPIFDFNIDVNYNYTKRLGAFLKVNNILNTKHYRWDMYANYGFNVLFGVNYSF